LFTERPKAEEIVHLPTGLALPFQGAMDMISGARLVCVGETHDNLHAHRVELLILRELHRRNPGNVAVGMEMFREPDQETLDRWTEGELTEIDFLKATKWYENWGSDFGTTAISPSPGEPDRRACAQPVEGAPAGSEKFRPNNVPEG
jgi:uncharacterized iron-regulated protein